MNYIKKILSTPIKKQQGFMLWPLLILLLGLGVWIGIVIELYLHVSERLHQDTQLMIHNF